MVDGLLRVRRRSQDGRTAGRGREYLDQRLDVAELGRQPGADDVIGIRHALDEIALQVGVRDAGRREERLPALQMHEVEQEKREQAHIIVAVLFSQREKALLDLTQRTAGFS